MWFSIQKEGNSVVCDRTGPSVFLPQTGSLLFYDTFPAADTCDQHDPQTLTAFVARSQMPRARALVLLYVTWVGAWPATFNLIVTPVGPIKLTAQLGPAAEARP